MTPAAAALELVEIACALTKERDLGTLLGLILEKSRKVTNADAGSIYVVEPATATHERRLRFKLSQNDSLSFESKEFVLPLDTESIAGAAAVSERPVRIDDVYLIDPGAPYQFDESFDARVGYRTRSVVALPMISARGQVLGVIQLINRKRSASVRLESESDVDAQVVPFDLESEQILQSLAAQAGIALENAMLYEEINRIFDGFVRASVHAIEQRDPTTSGHSQRVSTLSVALARSLERVDTGVYSNHRFSVEALREIEYAALLHDFGKIGVREQVLVKAKKLYPHTFTDIRNRFDFAQKSLEAEMLRRIVEAQTRGDDAGVVDRLWAELAERQLEIEDAWDSVSRANEPTVLSEGDFSRIAVLAERTYPGPRGEARRLLTPEEVLSLQVTRGSLNEAELEEIRSHVVHTFKFLSTIPWGRSLSRVPEIAGAHHERLNGTGYPHRKGASSIPLESRILAVADIYDALTARDRPYKKALSTERALDILSAEARSGHIDAALTQIFIDARVFEEKTDSTETAPIARHSHVG